MTGTCCFLPFLAARRGMVGRREHRGRIVLPTATREQLGGKSWGGGASHHKMDHVQGGMKSNTVGNENQMDVGLEPGRLSLIQNTYGTSSKNAFEWHGLLIVWSGRRPLLGEVRAWQACWLCGC